MKMKKSVRILVITVLAISFIALGIYTAWRTHNGSTDFDTFYYAAKRVVNNEPLYAGPRGVSPYIYPPFFACLITPLALFSLETASFLWYILSLLLFAASMALSVFLIFGHIDMRRIWQSAPFMPKTMLLVLTGAIFLDNITLLQSNILLFFAITAGLYCFKKRRPILGGSLFGLAISIKLLPVLFLVYFIIKREFRMAASIIMWAVFFTLILPSLSLGTQTAQDSLMTWNESMLTRSVSTGPNDDMMGQMFNPVNQSITASLSRWLIRDDAAISYWKANCYKKYPKFLLNIHGPLSRERVLDIAYIVEFLLIALTLYFCLKKKGREPSIVSNSGEFALIYLASLFLDPFLKTPHLIFIIFPAIFIVSRMDSANRSYRFLYTGFIIAVTLYLSLGLKLFRIFGFGTVSLLLLWLMALAIEREIALPAGRQASVVRLPVKSRASLPRNDARREFE